MAMKLKFVFTVLTILFMTTVISAQNGKIWNGKKCAVVLTYDDALDSQLDIAIPLLDSLGFKATFYIPGHAKTLKTRLEEWRQVATEGHELGNHTIFHPCHGKSRNQNWVKPEYDLDNYTLRRLIDEIEVQNVMLNAIDGKTKRTFAYTCGNTTVEGKSFIDDIKKDFVAARGVQRGINRWDNLNKYNLVIFGSNKNVTGKEFISKVKEAEKSNGLLIFLFHSLGTEVRNTTNVKAHKELLEYLSKNDKKIWVAPLVDVINYYDSKTKQPDR